MKELELEFMGSESDALPGELIENQAAVEDPHHLHQNIDTLDNEQ